MPPRPWKPCRSASVAFAVPRPRFAALSNAALAAHGVSLPHWRDAVTRYAAVTGPRGGAA